MTQNTALLEQAQNVSGVDHSKPTKGGPRIPVEGKCPARLVGYVELGVHAQPDFKGKSKQPEMEVQLTFECFGAKNLDTVEIDGKEQTVGRIIRPLPIALKLNERANFYKLFKSMDYGRGLDNMAKMLNDVFRLTISHGKSKSGNVFAKIDAIESPLIEQIDPETGDVSDTIDITAKVPQASYPLQLFIYHAPTFEQWQSIFIDGTYTKKTKVEGSDDVVEEEVSKNFLQEKIKASLNWEGSAMEALLLNLDECEEVEVHEEKPKKKKQSKKKSTKSAGKSSKKKTTVTESEDTKPVTESPSDDVDDMLEELGL